MNVKKDINTLTSFKDSLIYRLMKVGQRTYTCISLSYE